MGLAFALAVAAPLRTEAAATPLAEYTITTTPSADVPSVNILVSEFTDTDEPGAVCLLISGDAEDDHGIVNCFHIAGQAANPSYSYHEDDMRDKSGRAWHVMQLTPQYAPFGECDVYSNSSYELMVDCYSKSSRMQQPGLSGR